MNQSFAKSNDKYENIMSQIGKWTSFYRANPHRFIKEYFGIKLKQFQEILICEMFNAGCVCFIGCRGISKTWTTSLFASTKCVLYPGTACVVASATRKQARELIAKIEKDFMPKYPMFALEVEEITNNAYNTIVKFRNGSTIEVVTANQNARCGRANLLIIDEARMVDKHIIDSVLKKFMTSSRHAGYMDLDKYKDLPMERNQEMYLTSGWYSSHWIYNLFKDYAAGMIVGKNYFAAALPYQLSIKERLLDRRQVESDMASSDFNEVSWLMEMCAEFWSGAAGAIYAYDDIAPARRIKHAFYPPQVASLISDKRIKIPPKLANEIRIFSADIALMQSNNGSNNDATSIMINQMMLSDSGRSTKNIVYTENNEGLRTEEQALVIRRLFADYDCDYLVLDCRGIGLGVADALMGEIYDPERGVTYCALGCINNEEIHKRCKVKGAPKKIWAVMGTAEFNCQCALGLREEFRQGNVRLLGDEEHFDEDFSQLSGFSKLGIEDRAKLKAPYANTSLIVQELINLETEVKGNLVRVKEKSGMRKDRYSSLSYNIHLSKILEREHIANKNKSTFAEYVMQMRKPNIRKQH